MTFPFGINGPFKLSAYVNAGYLLKMNSLSDHPICRLFLHKDRFEEI